MEILQKLTDLNWLLHIFLVLLPGSVFVTHISKVHFPTGRYNSNFLLKIFLFLVVSFVFFACLPLLSPLGLNILASYLAQILGIDQIMAFIPATPNGWFALLADVFVPEPSIRVLSYFIVLVSITSILVSAVFSITIYFLEQETSKAILSTYLIKMTQYYAVELDSRWARWNEEKAKILVSKFPSLKGRGKDLTWFVVEATATILSQLFRLIYFVLVLALFLFFVGISSILRLFSWSFYYLTQFFHHPLYNLYCKSKMGRLITIGEIRTNDDILYKGRIHSFTPKNSSDIDSISIDCAIKYSLVDKNKSQNFVRESRSSYVFPSSDSVVTVPFQSIRDINVWHYKGTFGPNRSIGSKDDIESFAWYLKIFLSTHPFNPQILIHAINRLNIEPQFAVFFWSKVAILVTERYGKKSIFRGPCREVLLYIRSKLITLVPAQLNDKSLKALVDDMERLSGIKFS